VTDQETPESPSESAPPTEAGKTKNKSKKSWFISGFVIFVAGFLLWIVVAPQFEQPSCYNPAYNADSKANLHYVFLACKAYWADNGSDAICTHDIAQSTAYEYVKSPNVDLVAFGNDLVFVAYASHMYCLNIFEIDSMGFIQETSDLKVKAWFEQKKSMREKNDGDLL
jgi:hypothetical protein